MRTFTLMLAFAVACASALPTGNQQTPWSNNDQDYNQPISQQNTRVTQTGPYDYDTDVLADIWIDVQPFHTKITRRIEESDPLSTQPEIKRKILKLADDKLNTCKYSGAGNKGKVDKSCVGRATGQIMQLIAAFENGSRDLPGSYGF